MIHIKNKINLSLSTINFANNNTKQIKALIFFLNVYHINYKKLTCVILRELERIKTSSF